MNDKRLPMKILVYWEADFKLASGEIGRAYFGRVREGHKHRYLGPHSTFQLLAQAVGHAYPNEALETVYREEWNDVGPTDWNPQKEGVY